MTDMFTLPTAAGELTKIPAKLHIIIPELHDTQHTCQPTPTNRLTNACIATYLS